MGQERAGGGGGGRGRPRPAGARAPGAQHQRPSSLRVLRPDVGTGWGFFFNEVKMRALIFASALKHV